MNLFRFVVNPNDFAQSVENIFHLSFLIRDGKVALETNAEGEPQICKSFALLAYIIVLTSPICQTFANHLMMKTTLRVSRNVKLFLNLTWRLGGYRSFPCLITCLALNMRMFLQRAIEVFNITKSTIPQRPKSKVRLGDKWYG